MSIFRRVSARRIAATVMLLLLALVLWKLLLVGRHVLALGRYALRWRGLADNPTLILEGDRAAALVRDVRGAGSALHGLRSELQPMLGARWLPWNAGRRNLLAIDALLAIGADCATLAVEAGEALQPMFAVAGDPATATYDTPVSLAPTAMPTLVPVVAPDKRSTTPAAKNRAPATGGVSPGSGYRLAGQEQRFTTIWLDPDGWQDLRRCLFTVGVTAGSKGVSLYYNVRENRLYLRDDAGKQWLGGAEPGVATTISNSRAVLNCAGVTVVRERDRIQVTWPLTFLPAFAGPKNLYLRCYDTGRQASRWTQSGTWVVSLTDDEQPVSGMSDASVAVFSAALQSRSALQALAPRLVALQERIGLLQDEPLWPAVRSAMDLLAARLPPTRVGLRLLAELPVLLGEQGEVHYLLLAQNHDELRPTGGFITTIGLLSLAQGRILDLTSRDSYDLDKFTVDHPFAPQPMQQYMGIMPWVTRDGNWSPDFPTAARDIERLYDLENAPPIDGMIALDQSFLQRLVQVVGPLKLPGETRAITGDNLLSRLEEEWTQELPPEASQWAEWQQRRWLRSHRKDFVGPLARALFSRLRELPGEDWLRIARVVQAALEEKHLLLHFDAPGAQAALDEMGWSGALYQGADDSLLVLDMNMGYNKVNANVDKQVDYRVTLGATPQATLMVTYTNRSPAQIGCERSMALTKTYEMRTQGCYWNYLRVYAPVGSRLLSTRGMTATQTLTETNKTTFATFFVLPANARQTLQFDYDLPLGATNEYRLVVQKQAGTDAVPLRVEIVLPPHVQLLAADPAPGSQQASRLTFDLALERDRIIHVKWR